MSSREDVHKLLSTAGLLLLDAMVFHEVIAGQRSEIKTLSQITSGISVKAGLEEAWRYIIENIDYEPVLGIALKILESLPASPRLDAGLKELARLAVKIASSSALLRHDLFGRIYHTLLLGDLIKYYATYYTSIPAARLLARLLVKLPESPSVSLSEVHPKYDGEELKVVDFACGSGTLLSAMYKELMDGHVAMAGRPKADELHKYLIEEGLWGFDVLHHAIHLAATALSLHNPIPVNGSKLFALRLEAKGEQRLGSIDFLVQSEI
ncbi:MAG: hypothetical protein QXX17_03920, partial [Conexivisphaerales archaeon]